MSDSLYSYIRNAPGPDRLTYLSHAPLPGSYLSGFEFWTGTGGGQGFSLNFYEPAADRWRQVWVSAGSLIEIAGGPEAGSMVLSGEITYRRTGDVRPFRGRWTPLPDGRVRQLFEEYREGEGWQSWFDGIYSKVLE